MRQRKNAQDELVTPEHALETHATWHMARRVRYTCPHVNFSPSIYEHAAAIIGRSPWDVSRDADLMFRAHLEAYRTYGHSPVVVGIDIYNLEAEAYGGTTDRPDGNGIPAIREPVFMSVTDIDRVPLLDPESSGRIPMIIDVGVRLKGAITEADVCIPVSGPFSIACNLAGFETLLTECITDPDSVRAALDHLVDGQLDFVEEIHRNGLGVTLFDSGSSPPMVSPAIFREVVFPSLKKLVTGTSEITGDTVALIIGGDTYPILDEILATGAGFIICPSETDQASFMKKMNDHPTVMVRVNMSASIVAGGTWEECRDEALRTYEVAGNHSNALIGTGVLPYETSPEKVHGISGFLREKMKE